MTNLLIDPICYEIHAQNGSDLLVIKNKLKQNFFIKTAREILSDIDLLSGFSHQDAALIGVIAGMSIERQKFPHKND